MAVPVSTAVLTERLSYEHHLNHQFAPEKSDTPWVANISYIPTGEDYFYLASIMENFYRILKVELIFQNYFQNRREVQRDLYRYTEVSCNRERLHSFPNYCSL